jgi:hypothetical protein
MDSMEDDKLVGTKFFRERYDGRCSRTIDRWINDLEDFPKPTMINRRRYWRLGDLRHWERSRAVAAVGRAERASA